MHYRDYKKCDTQVIKQDFYNILKQAQITDYWCFQNKFATLKKKLLRYNNPFINKNLRKTIMTRSKLQNIYNKERAKQKWENYEKQIILCINLF